MDGKIVLEVGSGRGSLIQDECSTHIQEEMESVPIQPKWSSEEDSDTNARGTAEAIRAASRVVLPEWSVPESDTAPGSVADRAIEAQIAAAVEGRKPLYYEPWDNPDLSDQLAAEYRKVIPPEVAVESRKGFLYIYRPGKVKGILDSDPEFYRRQGESDFDSIARVSEDHSNGELLGYGARSMMDRPAHEVRIYKGKDLILYFFVSSPDEKKATLIADERTRDFFRSFQWSDLRYEIKLVD